MIETFCVCAIYISGSLGLQNHDDQRPWYEESNHYGLVIGDLSATIDISDHFFIQLKHISGVNYSEMDMGLNAIMIGARINLFESK